MMAESLPVMAPPDRTAKPVVGDRWPIDAIIIGSRTRKYIGDIEGVSVRESLTADPVSARS
jgi:hypothetical protein